MLFISWGYKHVSRPMGTLRHTCPACETERDCSVEARYSVRHFCQVFRWITGKSFRLCCQACQRIEFINANRFKYKLPRSPYPFFDRFGWVVAAVAIVALIGSALAAENLDNKHSADLLRSPRVNDIFEVDLAQIMKDSPAPVMISTMRVTKIIDLDTVEVEIARRYSDGRQLIMEDVDTGRAKEQSYYGDGRATFTVSALEDLQRRGAILKVDR